MKKNLHALPGKTKTRNVFKNILSLIVAFAIMFNLSYGAFDIKAGAATINHTADEAINYIKNQTANCQCVQYANNYIEYLCGKQVLPFYHPNWITTNPSAVSNFPLSLIQGAQPQKGDMIIWTFGEYGHIAIYESDYSWYDANYYSDTVVRHHTSYYKTACSGYWGVLRPDFGNVAPQSGETWQVSESIGSNVRSGPGTGYGLVAAWPQGTTFVVTEKAYGHLGISYENEEK